MAKANLQAMVERALAATRAYQEMQGKQYNATDLACAFKALANSRYDNIVFFPELSFDDGEMHVYARAYSGNTHNYDRGTLLANGWEYHERGNYWQKLII